MKHFIILLMLVTATSWAGGGGDGDVGNGGGTWTCREKSDQGPGTGALRWIQLIDLFEGRTERRLNIPKTSNFSVEELLDQIERKVFAFNPEVFAVFKDYLDQVKAEFNIINDAKLVVIPDADYRITPAPETCDGGEIAYEQIANDTEEGFIDVDARLYNSELLSTIDRAALYVHEAAYKWLRTTNDVKDSVWARELTAHLFSDRATHSYESLFPVSNEVVIPADAFHLKYKHVESLSLIWNRNLIVRLKTYFQAGKMFMTESKLDRRQPYCIFNFNPRDREQTNPALSIGKGMLMRNFFGASFSESDGSKPGWNTSFTMGVFSHRSETLDYGYHMAHCYNSATKAATALTTTDMRQIFGSIATLSAKEQK